MAPGYSSVRRQDHVNIAYAPSGDDSEAYVLEAPVTTRTNAELNLSVLQRHNPSIIQVLSIAPYAVIYVFSATSQTWEKTGIEGTLFVCRLAPSNDDGVADYGDDLEEELFRVMVLNRHGLKNFELDLRGVDDVEVTDDYVILQDTSGQGSDVREGDGNGPQGDSPVIYGLWIFAEPPPSSTSNMQVINAKVIQHCASRAEASRSAIAERRMRRVQEAISARDSTRSGNQLSTREVFGQPVGSGLQYSMDSGGSFNGVDQGAHDRSSGDVLGDLFRRARLEYGADG